MNQSQRIRDHKVISICEDTGLETLICDNCEKTMAQMIATALNGAVSSEWAFFYKAVGKDHELYNIPIKL